MKQYIPFMRFRGALYVFSGVLTVVSLCALLLWGLRYDIEFRGGTVMEVAWSGSMPEQVQITDALSRTMADGVSIESHQNGTTRVRFADSDDAKNAAVVEALRTVDPAVMQKSVNFIGPSVSTYLTRTALIAVGAGVISIALYIMWAFRAVSYPVPSWVYGACAVIALAHDLLITTGAAAAAGHFYGVEVGVPFIVALLTILGYSVNDTIVVYDRTRENLLRRHHREEFSVVVDRSLNETLSRSLNTGLTVLIVLVALFIVGPEALRWFTVFLFIGIAAGMYSSIFVASALLVTVESWRRRTRVVHAKRNR